MAKLIATDNGSCELVELTPYPSVVSTDSSVGVTPVVGPDGKTTYDVAAAPVVPTIATDNGDGSGVITNPDGSTVSICTECTVDTFATVTDSTVTDASGNSVTVPAGSTYNEIDNTITTSDGKVVQLMVDTDTDTFTTLNGDGDLVLADGTVVPLTATVDTNISEVAILPVGQNLRVTAVEDGVQVVGDMLIPDEALRKCTDKMMVFDRDLATWVWKPILPQAKTKFAKARSVHLPVGGAAVDALVNTVFASVSVTVDPFNEPLDCYNETTIAELRLGSLLLVSATANDDWRVSALGTTGNNVITNMGAFGTRVYNETGDIVPHNFAMSTSTSPEPALVGNTVPMQLGYELTFNPPVYTPNGANVVYAAVLTANIKRTQELIEV